MHVVYRIVVAVVILQTAFVSTAIADIDWREKGAVNHVQDQGGGTCDLSWAFAITAVVEGARVAQSSGPLPPSLSAQQLIDCASNCSGDAGACRSSQCVDFGCALTYVRENGLCSEDDYPYTGVVGECQPCDPVVPAGFATNWMRLSGESPLQGSLNSAPVLARLEIGVDGVPLQAYLDYDAGIFSPAPDSTDVSVVHWVAAVGYTGAEWLLKNSIGIDWGISGYLKLARGGNRLGVGNYIYALGSGPASQGACAFSDGSCIELSSDACSAAGGELLELGTFCAVSCPAAFEAPALSPEVIAAVVLLLLAFGLRSLSKRVAARSG